MSKYNFIKTIVPIDGFKEVEEKFGLTFVFFDAKRGFYADSYECVECSVRSADFNLEEAKSAYEQWKEETLQSSIAYAKKGKLTEIDNYDQSSKVNGFLLNGKTVWLDKATRVGLMNSTTIAKNMGEDTTDLWLGSLHLTVDCDKAIQLLSALEMYALQCFNVTAEHRKAVEELDSIEEIEKFDVTAGYPVQLEMTL